VDRIFAVIGLVRKEDRGWIVPGYNPTPNTVIRVFAQVSRVVLQKRNPYRALRWAGIGRRRNIAGLPSWAPDWTADMQTAILCHRNEGNDYNSSLHMEPRIESVEQLKTMTGRGAVFERINALGNVLGKHPRPDPPSSGTRCRSSLDHDRRVFPTERADAAASVWIKPFAAH
jgi:hypothetical protein